MRFSIKFVTCHQCLPRVWFRDLYPSNYVKDSHDTWLPPYPSPCISSIIPTSYQSVLRPRTSPVQDDWSRWGRGALPIFEYTARLPRKGYLFQVEGTRKGRDFKVWRKPGPSQSPSCTPLPKLSRVPPPPPGEARKKLLFRYLKGPFKTSQTESPSSRFTKAFYM